MPGNGFKPLVHCVFNVVGFPPIGLQGDDEFGQTFHQRDNGTIVVDAHNGVAFEMVELFLECRAVGLQFSNIP